MTVATAVVYVHGLWMVGIEGVLLRCRLARDLRAQTPFFRYPSVRADTSMNAARLAQLLSTLKVDTLHLVGHSLGGLVICKMFESGVGNSLPPGRVVLLGSPVAGSRAAQNVAALRIGKRILGASVASSLLRPTTPRWSQPRDLGLIAGTRNFGVGWIVNTHQAPSDGTVYVDETLIAGAKEHVTLSVSHTGLPLSREVATCTAHFMKHGSFSGRSV